MFPAGISLRLAHSRVCKSLDTSMQSLKTGRLLLQQSTLAKILDRTFSKNTMRKMKKLHSASNHKKASESTCYWMSLLSRCAFICPEGCRALTSVASRGPRRSHSPEARSTSAGWHVSRQRVGDDSAVRLGGFLTELSTEFRLCIDGALPSR